MSICHAASHLSVTEGDHEAYNQTASQFTIIRSKNASAAEAERGTHNKRSRYADGHWVGASLRVRGPSQPNGKSLVDRRVPLRVPRVGRSVGSLRLSRQQGRTNLKRKRMVRHAKRTQHTMRSQQSEGNVTVADESLGDFINPKPRPSPLCGTWHRILRRKLLQLTPLFPPRELLLEWGCLSCCGVSSFSSCIGLVYTL